MIEVINREILIPREEYNIGTCYDDNTETRHFHLKRVTSSGIDLAALTFNLDIKYANGQTDAASLLKEVTDKDINLTLTIGNSMLQVPGTVIIQIRALEEDGTCKWTSYQSNFFVEDHINTPGHYQGELTQLEQYEAEWGKVRDNVNQLNSRMDEVVKIHDETPATEVEEEVIDGRVGYNGTQYNSLGAAVRQQIIDVREDMEEGTADWTEALAAETAARQAADSTLQGNINAEASTRASQDASLQNQINQIIAPSGEAPSAAEVQNARIGVDGITYPTLGDAIRTQNSNVTKAINDGGAYNILVDKRIQDGSSNGITWVQNADGSVTATGTATSASVRLLSGSRTTIADGMTPGKTYQIVYHAEKVKLNIQVYKNDTMIINNAYLTSMEFTVPDDATGVYVRYIVSSGTENVNETVRAVILNELSNSMLNKKFGKYFSFAPNDFPFVESNEDFDDYVEDGQYRVSRQEIANTILHIPENKAGQLIVLHTTYDAVTTNTKNQIYVTINPTNVYIRYAGTDNVWGDWHKVAYQDAIDALSDNAVLMNATSSESLSSGADLNLYTSVGQWRIPSAAVSRSLLNKPKDLQTTGTLLVMNTHNANHVYQIIMANGGTNIWARHIMINEQIYDRWINLATADDGDYSWSKTGFLIHDPIEENQDMIDVIADILGITITDIGQWSDLDENNERIIPAEKIYDLWDDLQSKYPEYIDTGETIGYSKDTDGSNYAPIKAYYIHPRKSYVNWSGSTINISYQDMPTIYLNAGTHGGESTPTWTLFEIFRRAFLTGTIYSSFLTGLQFRVIPCLDIWSYDHKKRFLAAAYDANGDPKPEALDGDGEILEIYDANRQCICSDMDNPSYINLQLQSFASEAAALTSYLQTHNFGAVEGDSFIDMHNCSYSLGYLSTDNSDIAHFFKIMVDELNKDWMANTTFANGDPVDYYASSTSDHTKQRGKILVQSSTPKSFAWFFEKAYDSYASNILEVQGYDGPEGSKYAYAKLFDMTYRWFRTIFEKIKNL